MQRTQPSRLTGLMLTMMAVVLVQVLVGTLAGKHQLQVTEAASIVAVFLALFGGLFAWIRLGFGPLEWDEHSVRKANWPRWELPWHAITAVEYRRSNQGGLQPVLTGPDGRPRCLRLGLYAGGADELALAVVRHTVDAWERRVAEALHQGLTVRAGAENAVAGAAIGVFLGAFGVVGVTTLAERPADRVAFEILGGLGVVVVLLLAWRYTLAWTRIDGNGVEQYTGFRTRRLAWHAVRTLRLGRVQTDKTNIESVTLRGPEGKVVFTGTCPQYLLLVTVAARQCRSADVLDASYSEGERVWQYLLRRAFDPSAEPRLAEPPARDVRRQASRRVWLTVLPLVLIYVAVLSIPLLLPSQQAREAGLARTGLAAQALLYKRCGEGFHYEFSVGGEAYERHFGHRVAEGYHLGDHVAVVYDPHHPARSLARVDLPAAGRAGNRRTVAWVCQGVGWGLGLPWLVLVIRASRRRRKAWREELTRLAPEHQTADAGPGEGVRGPSVWDDDAAE